MPGENAMLNVSIAAQVQEQQGPQLPQLTRALEALTGAAQRGATTTSSLIRALNQVNGGNFNQATASADKLAQQGMRSIRVETDRAGASINRLASQNFSGLASSANNVSLSMRQAQNQTLAMIRSVQTSQKELQGYTEAMAQSYSARLAGIWAIQRWAGRAYQAASSTDVLGVSLARITGLEDANRLMTDGRVISQKYNASLQSVLSTMTELSRRGLAAPDVSYLTAAFAELRLSLATSTGEFLSMDHIMDKTTAMMQQLQIGTYEAIKAMNYMAELDIRTATSFDAISEALTRFAATGKIARMTTYDMIDAAAALTSAGFSGEQTGTALQTILSRIARNEKAISFMRRFGVTMVSTDDDVAKVNNSLEMLYQTYQKITAQNNYMALRQFLELFAGTRMQSKAVALLEAYGRQMEDFSKFKISATDMGAEADAKRLGLVADMMDTIVSKREMLNNAFNAAFVNEDFIRALKNGTDTMANVLMSLGSMLSGASLGTLSSIGTLVPGMQLLSPSKALKGLLGFDEDMIARGLDAIGILLRTFLAIKIPFIIKSAVTAAGMSIVNSTAQFASWVQQGLSQWKWTGVKEIISIEALTENVKSATSLIRSGTDEMLQIRNQFQEALKTGYKSLAQSMFPSPTEIAQLTSDLSAAISRVSLPTIAPIAGGSGALVNAVSSAVAQQFTDQSVIKNYVTTMNDELATWQAKLATIGAPGSTSSISGLTRELQSLLAVQAQLVPSTSQVSTVLSSVQQRLKDVLNIEGMSTSFQRQIDVCVNALDRLNSMALNPPTQAALTEKTAQPALYGVSSDVYRDALGVMRQMQAEQERINILQQQGGMQAEAELNMRRAVIGDLAVKAATLATEMSRIGASKEMGGAPLLRADLEAASALMRGVASGAVDIRDAISRIDSATTLTSPFKVALAAVKELKAALASMPPVQTVSVSGQPASATPVAAPPPVNARQIQDWEAIDRAVMAVNTHVAEYARSISTTANLLRAVPRLDLVDQAALANLDIASAKAQALLDVITRFRAQGGQGSILTPEVLDQSILKFFNDPMVLQGAELFGAKVDTLTRGATARINSMVQDSSRLLDKLKGQLARPQKVGLFSPLIAEGEKARAALLQVQNQLRALQQSLAQAKLTGANMKPIIDALGKLEQSYKKVRAGAKETSDSLTKSFSAAANRILLAGSKFMNSLGSLLGFLATLRMIASLWRDITNWINRAADGVTDFENRRKLQELGNENISKSTTIQEQQREKLSGILVQLLDVLLLLNKLPFGENTPEDNRARAVAESRAYDILSVLTQSMAKALVPGKGMEDILPSLEEFKAQFADKSHLYDEAEISAIHAFIENFIGILKSGEKVDIEGLSKEFLENMLGRSFGALGPETEELKTSFSGLTTVVQALISMWTGEDVAQRKMAEAQLQAGAQASEATAASHMEFANLLTALLDNVRAPLMNLMPLFNDLKTAADNAGVPLRTLDDLMTNIGAPELQKVLAKWGMSSGSLVGTGSLIASDVESAKALLGEYFTLDKAGRDQANRDFMALRATTEDEIGQMAVIWSGSTEMIDALGDNKEKVKIMASDFDTMATRSGTMVQNFLGLVGDRGILPGDESTRLIRARENMSSGNWVNSFARKWRDAGNFVGRLFGFDTTQTEHDILKLPSAIKSLQEAADMQKAVASAQLANDAPLILPLDSQAKERTATVDVELLQSSLDNFQGAVLGAQVASEDYTITTSAVIKSNADLSKSYSNLEKNLSSAANDLGAERLRLLGVGASTEVVDKELQKVNSMRRTLWDLRRESTGSTDSQAKDALQMIKDEHDARMAYIDEEFTMRKTAEGEIIDMQDRRKTEPYFLGQIATHKQYIEGLLKLYSSASAVQAKEIDKRIAVARKDIRIAEFRIEEARMEVERAIKDLDLANQQRRMDRSIYVRPEEQANFELQNLIVGLDTFVKKFGTTPAFAEVIPEIQKLINKAQAGGDPQKLIPELNTLMDNIYASTASVGKLNEIDSQRALELAKQLEGLEAEKLRLSQANLVNEEARAEVVSRMSSEAKGGAYLPFIGKPNHEPSGDQLFGKGRDDGTRSHAGLDFSLPKGMAIVPMFDGTVSKVVPVEDGNPGGLRVWVEHMNGLKTAYMHLSETLVKVGDKVTGGVTRVGTAGYSGNWSPDDGTSQGVHVEVRRNGTAFNPMDFLQGAQTGQLAKSTAEIVMEAINSALAGADEKYGDLAIQSSILDDIKAKGSSVLEDMDSLRETLYFTLNNFLGENFTVEARNALVDTIIAAATEAKDKLPATEGEKAPMEDMELVAQVLKEVLTPVASQFESLDIQQAVAAILASQGAGFTGSLTTEDTLRPMLRDQYRDALPEDAENAMVAALMTVPARVLELSKQKATQVMTELSGAYSAIDETGAQAAQNAEAIQRIRDELAALGVVAPEVIKELNSALAQAKAQISSGEKPLTEAEKRQRAASLNKAQITGIGDEAESFVRSADVDIGVRTGAIREVGDVIDSFARALERNTVAVLDNARAYDIDTAAGKEYLATPGQGLQADLTSGYRDFGSQLIQSIPATGYLWDEADTEKSAQLLHDQLLAEKEHRTALYRAALIESATEGGTEELTSEELGDIEGLTDAFGASLDEIYQDLTIQGRKAVQEAHYKALEELRNALETGWDEGFGIGFENGFTIEGWEALRKSLISQIANSISGYLKDTLSEALTKAIGESMGSLGNTKLGQMFGELFSGLLGSLIGYAIGALFADPTDQYNDMVEEQRKAQRDRVTSSGFDWTYREAEKATPYYEYSPPITQESVKIVKFSNNFNISTDAAKALMGSERELRKVIQEIITDVNRTMAKTVGAKV